MSGHCHNPQCRNELPDRHALLVEVQNGRHVVERAFCSVYCASWWGSGFPIVFERWAHELDAGRPEISRPDSSDIDHAEEIES